MVDGVERGRQIQKDKRREITAVDTVSRKSD
jgi:hypothetical protein